jgi:hypothetical protein
MIDPYFPAFIYLCLLFSCIINQSQSCSYVDTYVAILVFALSDITRLRVHLLSSTSFLNSPLPPFLWYPKTSCMLQSSAPSPVSSGLPKVAVPPFTERSPTRHKTESKGTWGGGGALLSGLDAVLNVLCIPTHLTSLHSYSLYSSTKQDSLPPPPPPPFDMQALQTASCHLPHPRWR